MNLHIVSNTISQGTVENKTNQFEMKLIQPIDALNNDAYLEVLHVCYPLTTKNILKDTCSLYVHMQYKDYQVPNKNTSYTKGGSFMRVDIDPYVLPEGIYTLKQLVKCINNYLERYDIFFTIEENGKIKLSNHFYTEYWLDNESSPQDGRPTNEFNLLIKSSHGNKCQYEMFTQLYMSTKLAFILGYVDKILYFSQKITKALKTPFLYKHPDYLPDVSDGLNKLYIYCEQLESTLVGDTYSDLLAAVPIQWMHQGKGAGELACFIPAKSLKKFKKTNINTLSIKVRDSAGVLVPFDSGSISIECLLHYA